LDPGATAEELRDGCVTESGSELAAAGIGVGDGRDTRLMLQIGAGLGALYLAFLGLWFWATRLRPREAVRRGS
jgi:hypothetical protein